jgi:hypothetical protein
LGINSDALEYRPRVVQSSFAHQPIPECRALIEFA